MKATKKELFYNEFSDEWESKINRQETEKRLKVVFGKLLEGINLRGKKFLEIGCGLGYFSERAVGLGAEVTGLDIGEKLIEKVKQRVPKGKFFVASASNLPFRNESFDVVLCTEVIEHVDKQKAALSEMLRVLKRRGVLAITTPNRIFKPLFIFLSSVGLRPYNSNEKWLFPWEMRSRLVKQGTKIIKEEYFNFIYPIRLLDFFEKFRLLHLLMINQGYLVSKT